MVPGYHLTDILLTRNQYQVFRKVEKQLPQLTTLDLQYVSPQLLKARNLELAMPGELFDSLMHYSSLTSPRRQVPIRAENL
jgi:phosphatidylinositol kinase/protein kinase (PI-3  family)